MTEQEATGLAANMPDVTGFYHWGRRTASQQVDMMVFRGKVELEDRWQVCTAFTIDRRW